MPDTFDPTLLPRVQGQPVEIRPGRWLSISHQPGHAHADTVVFFAHGGGGNQDQWREQWRALGQAGYSLVAWDLLGHGRSAKPRQRQAYAWDELVNDQRAVLARFAGQRNIIAAHSFGTGLTLSAVLDSPVAVEALLLLGTTLNRPLKPGGLLRLPAWALELLRPVLSKGFRQRAWDTSAAPALIAYEESLTRHNPLYVFKGLIDGARWPSAAQLASLELPVQVLAGRSDGLTPVAGGEALAQALPHAQFRVLEQCGHQLMLERPEVVNEALLALLVSRESATGTGRSSVTA